MPVNIKSSRVDELLNQLRQLTGRGATDIVREAIEQELQRQRRLRHMQRLQEDLPGLQQQAAVQVRPFAAEQLYDDLWLPV
ncbi:MAG: type II toxin-antitoxin system VapB family antitoxin [Cyanobium sp.]